MSTVHAAWLAGHGAIGTEGAASAVFPWWSFTRTVLAIAALRLWEEGCHDIHRALEGRPFTTLQLLQNRAGLQRRRQPSRPLSPAIGRA